ncbi:MAG TPA: ABC transporter substrate-binding protein [Spirochaetota bacterium]
MFRNLILTMAVLLCGTPVFPAEEIIISVPRTLSSLPVYELNGKTIAGYETTVRFYDDHILAMAEFVSGRSPILMTGFSQGLSYYRSSGKTVLLANPVWGLSSLVTAEQSLQQLSDFKGKTILVPFANSPLDVQMRMILGKEVPGDQIRIGYSPIPQQVPLLLAGKAEGGCLPEPFATQFVMEKKGKRIFPFAQKWAEINNGERRTPQVSLFAKSDFAASHKAYCSALIDELQKNCLRIAADKEKLSEKYAAIFKIDKRVIAESLGYILFEMPDDTTERKLVRDYQLFIGDKSVINDTFFRNQK